MPPPLNLCLPACSFLPSEDLADSEQEGAEEGPEEEEILFVFQRVAEQEEEGEDEVVEEEVEEDDEVCVSDKERGRGGRRAGLGEQGEGGRGHNGAGWRYSTAAETAAWGTLSCLAACVFTSAFDGGRCARHLCECFACVLMLLPAQERSASPILNLFGGTRKVESLATQVGVARGLPWCITK